MRENYFYEYKCANCGKQICLIDPELWGYKMERGSNQPTIYACSWKCFRQIPAVSNQRGKRSGKKEIIFDLLRQGKSIEEIALETGTTKRTVKYWQDRFKD